ncbi:MAG: SprT family zinc-dependent metalloprotease [Syntrophorhabdaceae bacterium]|nr:M48 family metallopeptidase [Syntrophorhabdaceae bacterium]MDD4195752.1 SprT family zinc-dependent metalloprotease [Syntrophorhabdaceae bacterium]HOC46746.1 SprT family zinc-dependent metalloprotease [Syntrophorhabdaceae bacterium]
MEEQASLFNDTEFLNYRIVRSKNRKRTMTLKLERNGAVVILVPERTPKEEILRFFKSKVPWINKKLDEYGESLENACTPKTFTGGEKFLYLGEEYPLEITEGPTSRLTLSHGTFTLCKNHNTDGRRMFVRWYKARAHDIFAERVSFYARDLGLRFNGIRITTARTRYGSCSLDDRLSFSYRLVMAPYHIIDYIIVHELAHIRIKNHSKDFWGYVEKVLPDYRQCKAWLKMKGHLLDV